MIRISESARTKRFLVVLSAVVLLIGLAVTYAEAQQQIPQCRDNIDNDGDGLKDYPNDPGCRSGTDNDERNSTQCSDGRDNADPEDTLSDAADPGCHTDGDATDGDATYNPNDDDERNKPECSDDRDNADPEDTLADAADPGCHSDGDPNDGDNTYTPLDNDETDRPECSDNGDNADPEDTLADAADPGCHTDGDPNNPNSYDPTDDDETDPPECSDGRDNADPEDTLADEADPGCHTDGDPNDGDDTYDPTDDDETDLPECSDNGDNADPEDELADEDDPGCHTDGDPTNPDTYDPTDDDETDPGTFTCRASAYRIEDSVFNIIVDEDPFEPVVANDAEDPCTTESDSHIDVTVAGAPGSVTAEGLFADTDESGTADAGAASGTVADSLGVTVVGAETLSAHAEAGCDADGNPTLTGSSFVGTVTVLGDEEEIGTEHEEIEIPGVGILHLNETIIEDTDDGQRLTQRAFWLDTDTDLGDIIIGEAVADYHGNPC